MDESPAITQVFRNRSCLKTHHLLRDSGEEPLSFFVFGEKMQIITINILI